MKLCILHCGHPKTGTSSLQRFLAGNADKLARHGILYPALQRPGHSAVMPWVGFQHGYALKLMTKGANWSKGRGELERLHAAIESNPHEVLLLSGEYLFDALFYHRMPKIWRSLKNLGYQIETISYLRDQPERLSSAYAQQCKAAHIQTGFDAFCQLRVGAGEAEDADKRGTRPMYYDRLVEDGLHDWGQHHFRPFAAEVKKHGIEADFMTALREVLAKHDLAGGLTEAEAVALERPPRLNDSDGVILVALCRSLTQRMEEMLKDHTAATEGQRRKVEQAVFLTARATIAELAIDDPKYSAISPERMLRLRENFAASNQTFAGKAWGRDWAEVFPAPDPARLASNDLDDTHDPVLREQYERALAVAERGFAEMAGKALGSETRKGRVKGKGKGRKLAGAGA